MALAPPTGDTASTPALAKKTNTAQNATSPRISDGARSKPDRRRDGATPERSMSRSRPSACAPRLNARRTSHAQRRPTSHRLATMNTRTQRKGASGKPTRLLAYEHHSQPLLPFRQFANRLVGHVVLSAGLIAACLGGGVLGYHFAAGLSWLDALVDAAMILSGMGPVNPLTSSSGKLFAAGYALFSGIAFLAITGIMVAPVLHRLLHKLHLDSSGQ